MFPTSIEKWRGTVKQVINDLSTQKPKKISSINALGLTISSLEDIVLGIIYKESSGVPSAIGDNGNSIGLMQLNYKAGTPQGEGYGGPRDGLLDPYKNIYYGTLYFIRQFVRYQGNANSAILAYNAGSVIMATDGKPINVEYLSKVLEYLKTAGSDVYGWITGAVETVGEFVSEKKTSDLRLLESSDLELLSGSSSQVGSVEPIDRDYPQNRGCLRIPLTLMIGAMGVYLAVVLLGIFTP